MAHGEAWRPLFRRLAAAVIPRRGLDLGVARELQDRPEIGAGVEQIPDERAPQVVRRERCHAGLHRSAAMYSMACPDIPLDPSFPPLLIATNTAPGQNPR
jgi:hypothetical protein